MSSQVALIPYCGLPPAPADLWSRWHLESPPCPWLRLEHKPACSVAIAQQINEIQQRGASGPRLFLQSQFTVQRSYKFIIGGGNAQNPFECNRLYSIGKRFRS